MYYGIYTFTKIVESKLKLKDWAFQKATDSRNLCNAIDSNQTVLS